MRRVLRGLGLAALTLVALVGAYVAVVAVRHDHSRALPTPTGPFAVGRAMFEWTDPDRPDPWATLDVGSRPVGRALAVWLWYPAAGPGEVAGPYAPGLWSGLHFVAPLGWGETRFDRIDTHEYDGAPAAPGPFPLVVLEPGLGFSAPQYTTLAVDLASHGYLVLGVTPTYSANLTVLDGHVVGSNQDGNPPALEAGDRATGDRLVEVWAADARFAARRLARPDPSDPYAELVDLTRVAYIGHSFGGAASLEACRTDPACVGAVDLDGTLYGPVARTGLSRPFLIVGSEGSCVTGTCPATDPGDQADRDVTRAFLARSTHQHWGYEIRGTRHFDFTDYAAYYLAAPLRRLLALGTLEGDRSLQVTDAYLVAFLDQETRGSDEPLLTDAPSPYPEVEQR